VGRVIGGDTEAGGGAGHMRPMSVAIEWVGVGVRNAPDRVGIGGIIGVAGEIDPTKDLGSREGARLDDRAVVAGVGSERSGAAEIGVGVVDPTIHDTDAYPAARGAVG